MVGPLTYLDVGLLAIALISGLLAMYRGFSREVLSILSWIVAVAALGYFVFYHKPAAEQLAQQFHVPTIVAQVVTGAIIFLVVLIIVHLVTARISDSILDSRVGMIDRILGLGLWRHPRLPRRHDRFHVLRGVLPGSEEPVCLGAGRKDGADAAAGRPALQRHFDKLRSETIYQDGSARRHSVTSSVVSHRWGWSRPEIRSIRRAITRVTVL